ncbi:MAG: DUF302 domain-containing protein [Actinomycetota bacterium]|nr:DUF302 domain-containing protein [Actinomycetota bacterium]
MEGLEKVVPGTMEQVEDKVRVALKAAGFGVLTEIDMSATLREKIGVERAPMKVLGACNPNLIHQALEMSNSVALFVPCNVVLQMVDGGIKVSALDPMTIMAAPEMEELGLQARGLLVGAIASLDGVNEATTA